MHQPDVKCRKKYEKPMAVTVDFSLASSIAADCKSVPTATDGVCEGFYDIDNGWVAYAATPGGSCNFYMESTEHFCYHVPTESRTVLNS